MRYLVVVPISHNGQRLGDGAVVDDVTAYGVRVKSPLPVARLLARGRISPLAPAAPVVSIPSTESGPKPAQSTAAALDAQAEKRKFK